MLYEQFLELYHAGKYAEALPVAEEYAELAKKQYGESHFEYAIALNNLAEIYRTQNRLDEAQNLFEKALKIEEVTLGENHENVAIRLYNLARLHDDRENFQTAEKLLYRAIQIWEKNLGNDHHQLAIALNTLAEVYTKQNREEEAEPLFEHALIIFEKQLGRDHSEIAVVLKNLANISFEQGYLDDAKPKLKRALEIEERNHGPLHVKLTKTLIKLAEIYEELGNLVELEEVLSRTLKIFQENNIQDSPEITHINSKLANLYIEQERFEEAKPLAEKSYEAHLKAFGAHHPKTAFDLNSLAEIQRFEGQTEDLEKKYKFALEVLGKSLGLKHLYVGMVFNNLATFFKDQKRNKEAIKLYNFAIDIHKDHYGLQHIKVALLIYEVALIYHHSEQSLPHAETLYKRALDILEKQSGPRHPAICDIMYNLGKLYHALEKYEEAESFYKMVLKIHEDTVGAKHASVADFLLNFTSLYEVQGKYEQAIPLYKYSMEIWSEQCVANDPKMAMGHLKIAHSYDQKSDWSNAYEEYSKANNIITYCLNNGQIRFVESLELQNQPILPNSYIKQAKTAYNLSQKNADQIEEYKNDGFICSQLAMATASNRLLDQIANDYDGDDEALSELILDKNVLTTKRRGNYQNLKETLAEADQTHDKMAEATQKKLIENIDENLSNINLSLKEDFKDYMDLMTPMTLSLKETQQQLRKDEALIHYAFDDNDGIAWVITHDESYWSYLSIGINKIREDVEKLQYGLDHRLWQTMGTASRGQQILEIDYNWGNYSKGQPLPFDLSIAHDLYRNLFGNILEYIKDCDLIIIAPEPLTELSLRFLVTDDKKTGTPTKYSEYRKVSWLGIKHCITTLPSISSLRALRSTLEISEPKKSYLGICNNFFPERKIHSDTKASDSKQESNGHDKTKRSSLSRVANFSRGVLIDTNILRYEIPEADSIEELRKLSQSFKEEDIDILNKKDASISKLKDLHQDGKLRDYGIIHFANPVTMVANEHEIAEPAIQLRSPEDQNYDANDHLLKASDIIQLHVNANWIVLPAPERVFGKEGHTNIKLNVLAQTFFFSGAQSILISHWPVNSAASSQILQEIFKLLEETPDLGRSAALSQAIMNLTQDKSRPWNSHPSTWGAFEIIGEGSAI